MSNKPKILIVDDEADNIRKPLVRQLRREFRDYEFLEAENGEIALGLIEENRPALVILDLMMPVMNGIETLNELSNRKLLESTRVLVYTAAADKKVRTQALQMGALDYLEKTAPMEEVHARIRNFLALKTSEESLLESHSQTIKVIDTVIGLIRGPLALVAQAMENQPQAIKEYEKLKSVPKILGQFRRYLALPELQVNIAPINVYTIMETTIVECKAPFRQPPSGPLLDGMQDKTVMGDEKLIKEVLNILLENAANHALPDTEIKISAIIKGEDVEISVDNRHAGIAADKIDLLFTPFALPDEGGARGFGIDLAIAAAIMEKLGGTIGCESKENDWTSLKIGLPVASADALKASPKRT
ncbi:MAG: response regulator [Rhodospirillaceae bacterium]|jgi:DNA-binding response OmpR family regulator|nr:response regulator [Rhodospirillaceae bacterium]MBT8005581.1 response regulator [Rhodospirillales bacterium]MBT4700698.1 response regulator [Rhodospirillaceae bacterium]MBT5036517.1 response regulator [Rhodospirillaceae bacterium]MBT6221270.1 response regulator [Rhodospirillaceae bacterium]